MPSYWELKSELDKLRPVRRDALSARASIVEQQAKLAEELTVAYARLAEVVADIALIEVQQKTDKVFGKVDNIKSA